MDIRIKDFFASRFSIKFVMDHYTVLYRTVVRLGEHRLSEENKAVVQQIGVTAIFKHEKYSDETFVNDIAIVKLAHDAVLSGKIKSGRSIFGRGVPSSYRYCYSLKTHN